MTSTSRTLRLFFLLFRAVSLLPQLSIPFCPSPCFLPPTTTVCSSTPFFPIPFPLFSFSVFSLLLPRFLKNYEHRSREMQRNHSRDDVFDRVRVYTFNERLFVGWILVGMDVYGCRWGNRRRGVVVLVVALSRKRN